MFKFKITMVLALLLSMPLIAYTAPSLSTLNSHATEDKTMMYSDQQYFEQLFDITFNQPMPPDQVLLAQLGVVGMPVDLDTRLIYFIQPHNPYFGSIKFAYDIDKDQQGIIVAYRLTQVSAQMGLNINSDLTTVYLENRFREKFKLDTSGMGGVTPWDYYINYHSPETKYRGTVSFILNGDWREENVSIRTISLAPIYLQMTPIPKSTPKSL